MKVSVEDREGLLKALSVEVEGELVKSSLEEVYEQLKKNAEIKGFRKGQAPLWLIKAKFKEHIEEEVGKKVANSTLKEAIDESGLKPVADIFLDKVELDDKTPKVSYTVIFEVAPDFELKDVEGIEIEAPKVEFNEKLLQQRIDALREQHAVWEPVEDREVKEGDMVLIGYEVEAIQDGEKVSGDTSGIVGRDMFRPEVDKELIGKKVGDEFEIKELPLYDEKGNEVGKANLKIEVKEIKEKVLPEPGDDFAKELGYENWEEALKNIEKDVKETVENVRKTLIEDRVADKLLSMHEFEVPKTLLSRELSFLIDKKAQRWEEYGIDRKYLDFKKMAEELKPQAEANIKLRYILDKYAQVHGIEATDEDIEEELELLAQQSGSTKEELKAYFEKENMMNVVKEDARRRKALEDIVSKANIREVEAKQEEEEEGKEEEAST